MRGIALVFLAQSITRSAPIEPEQRYFSEEEKKQADVVVWPQGNINWNKGAFDERSLNQSLAELELHATGGVSTSRGGARSTSARSTNHSADSSGARSTNNSASALSTNSSLDPVKVRVSVTVGQTAQANRSAAGPGGPPLDPRPEDKAPASLSPSPSRARAQERKAPATPPVLSASSPTATGADLDEDMTRVLIRLLGYLQDWLYPMHELADFRGSAATEFTCVAYAGEAADDSRKRQNPRSGCQRIHSTRQDLEEGRDLGAIVWWHEGDARSKVSALVEALHMAIGTEACITPRCKYIVPAIIQALHVSDDLITPMFWSLRMVKIEHVRSRLIDFSRHMQDLIGPDVESFSRLRDVHEALGTLVTGLEAASENLEQQFSHGAIVEKIQSFDAKAALEASQTGADIDDSNAGNRGGVLKALNDAGTAIATACGGDAHQTARGPVSVMAATAGVLRVLEACFRLDEHAAAGASEKPAQLLELLTGFFCQTCPTKQKFGSLSGRVFDYASMLAGQCLACELGKVKAATAAQSVLEVSTAPAETCLAVGHTEIKNCGKHFLTGRTKNDCSCKKGWIKLVRGTHYTEELKTGEICCKSQFTYKLAESSRACQLVNSELDPSKGPTGEQVDTCADNELPIFGKHEPFEVCVETGYKLSESTCSDFQFKCWNREHTGSHEGYHFHVHRSTKDGIQPKGKISYRTIQKNLDGLQAAGVATAGVYTGLGLVFPPALAAAAVCGIFTGLVTVPKALLQAANVATGCSWVRISKVSYKANFTTFVVPDGLRLHYDAGGKVLRIDAEEAAAAKVPLTCEDAGGQIKRALKHCGEGYRTLKNGDDYKTKLSMLEKCCKEIDVVKLKTTLGANSLMLVNGKIEAPDSIETQTDFTIKKGATVIKVNDKRLDKIDGSTDRDGKFIISEVVDTITVTQASIQIGEWRLLGARLLDVDAKEITEAGSAAGGQQCRMYKRETKWTPAKPHYMTTADVLHAQKAQEYTIKADITDPIPLVDGKVRFKEDSDMHLFSKVQITEVKDKDDNLVDLTEFGPIKASDVFCNVTGQLPKGEKVELKIKRSVAYKCPKEDEKRQPSSLLDSSIKKFSGRDYTKFLDPELYPAYTAEWRDGEVPADPACQLLFEHDNLWGAKSKIFTHKAAWRLKYCFDLYCEYGAMWDDYGNTQSENAFYSWGGITRGAERKGEQMERNYTDYDSWARTCDN